VSGSQQGTNVVFSQPQSDDDFLLILLLLIHTKGSAIANGGQISPYYSNSGR
jgi:hypothetical protein